MGPTSDKLDRVVHLTHIHLANQRNMVVANTFGRARAHTPTQAHPRQVGLFFLFFSEAPLRPASIKPGRMVHLYRAHTAHPKHLVFCKSLDANPVEKKKKNSEFRTFLAHCGTWHGQATCHMTMPPVLGGQARLDVHFIPK